MQTVLVTTVLVVMCVGRISTDILNQSVGRISTGQIYSCNRTMSLCPHTYATCSCTISNSPFVYNQWNLSKPLCAGNYSIRLLRKGPPDCSNQYQHCGLIRAWNEPQSDASTGNEICKTTTLLINAHHKLNGLMFECQEYNTTIKIIAHPHTPYITAVYRLSPTQLTVVWSPASSGGPSTSFNISISAEGANASLMNTTIVGADGKSRQYSYTFTNLTSSTTYTVSVVAINCAGNSNPVNHTGVTALECQDGTIYSDGMLAVYGRNNLIVITPPDAPNITAVYSLSPTQLTVVWSPASTGSFPTSFSVSISANASLMSTAIIGADRNRTKEYSYTFTTLIEGTMYTMSVVAINCAGNSDPVNHTGVTEHPDTPYITAVYSLSATQLTVVWSPASTGSFPTSFSVSISANAFLMSTAIVGADERSHTFINLTSSTNYTVSVLAINCAGNSSSVNYTGVTAFECQDGTIYSNRMLAVYGQTPPDAPNITAVYRLSPTQLTVVWSPASTGSFPTSFNVSISANASLMHTAIVGADESSHTFLGLASSTTYTVSVVAINCAGNSGPVNQTGVTVPPDAPNITAVYSLSPTQLTVVWSPASSGSFPTSFSVSISESVNASLMSTAIVGADKRLHTFINLTSSINYTVSVVAINCAGNSSLVYYTGVTDLVWLMTSSSLQKDDIIEITTSIGGAALVLLIAVTILCICKGRCKKRANGGGGYVPILPQPSPPDALPQHEPPEQTPLRPSPAQHPGSLGPPSLLLLMSFPASGDNINIIQRIGANYYNFGIFLLNDKTGGKVEALKLEHQLNAEAITRAILSKWLQEGGREWSTLVAALRKVNLDTLADQVEVVTMQGTLMV